MFVESTGVRDALDADVLQPVGDQGQRVLADLAGRRAELDLGLQAVLLPDAVGAGTQPAASRIDLAFAGSNVAGGWSAKNQALGRDVRVGDLDGAAQEPGVDLVLVDRVG